jgi:hypothetical protein
MMGYCWQFRLIWPIAPIGQAISEQSGFIIPHFRLERYPLFGDY